MHSFLETLDTNQLLPVKIVISPIVDNGIPNVTVTINQQALFHGQLVDTVELTTNVSLLDSIDLSVTMQGKEYSAERETAVTIDAFTVDNVELIPAHQLHVDYHNDQNQNVKSHYLGFNGAWSFRINEPFYNWLHRATWQGWILQPAR